ncbi:MAG: major Facilitator Superfamily protein [Rhodospirillales bacterium]|nr:major Facilitator Superfamily protein [Rhodospirillales bacterium]
MGSAQIVTDESGRNALSFRDYRFFIGMRLPAALAVQMQSVAVGWQVYDISHTPLALGLVGLAQFLPVFGLALITGHIADRFNRRWIAAICLGLQLLCSLFLLMLAHEGSTRVWPIYCVLVLFGAARAFSGPATQSLLPNLVPRELLSRAFAWNSSSFQAMTIGGPALGGLIYAFGPTYVYATSASLFLLSIFSALMIRKPLAPRERRGTDWNSLLAGIRFIRARPAIAGAISLDLFAVLFGGATALLPVYARDILSIGPLGLGILRSAPAVGAVVVGLILAHGSLGRHAGRTMFVAIGLFGIATIIFGLSTNFVVSLGALVVLGASDMISVFVRQNLVQRATPDSMRGRVNAVNSVFIGASNELGEMESGATAAWLGSVEAVVVGGIGTLVVMGLWFWRFPELRKVDRLEDIESP